MSRILRLHVVDQDEVLASSFSLAQQWLLQHLENEGKFSLSLSLRHSAFQMNIFFKEKRKCIVHLFSMKVPRSSNAERIIVSIKGARINVDLHTF